MLLIVFVIELAVTPWVDKVRSVVVNMVVWLVILLIPVIVLGFAVEWHVGVIIGLVSAIKHVMGINYDLSWSSVVEIFVMVDPFTFMVVITLIFAVKASVRVRIHIVLAFLLFDTLRDFLTTLRVDSSFVNIKSKAIV